VNKKYKYTYLTTCIIIFITLCPITLNIPTIFLSEHTSYNFQPFVDLLYGYGNYLEEILANIILFIPFTICLRKETKCSLLKATLLGILFSFCIEITQPLISDIRVCDITDLITNSIGALIGAIIYEVYKHE